MSKIRYFVVVIGLSLSYFAHANPSAVEKEVLASFHSLVDASKQLDVDRYFQHFDADKFIGLNSDGTNWNSIEELSPLIAIGFDSIHTVTLLEFPNIKVSVVDDYTAILVNEYTQSMLLKNGTSITVSGGGTQVWSKRTGQWKLVSVSASNKPQTHTQSAND